LLSITADACTAAVDMSNERGGHGHVIGNGVMPLSQRFPVQHSSAAATAIATDDVQTSVSTATLELML